MPLATLVLYSLFAVLVCYSSCILVIDFGERVDNLGVLTERTAATLAEENKIRCQ